MRSYSNCQLTSQLGFTLIELMITIAVIGILSAIGVASYQMQVRQAQLTNLYQELNQFRLPYQILINEGAGVSGFSPSGLNILEQTKYCKFEVTKPNVNGMTIDAVRCNIQNLSYMQGQSLSLDRASDGTWQCRASSGVSKAYLPKACQ